MARIEEKIAEIADPELRQIIAEEVANLKKHTRFGLVFEDHQPEVVPIYGKRIKRGERVAKKAGNLAEIWRVVSIKDGIALCEQEKGGKAVLGTRVPYPTQQLVVIRSMGETIYPSLTPVASVVNGDPTAPHHVLIEADNYHALQLLLFPYEGKVDCIYIDPPYNSGARDWKYNNDYVDGNDAWRHSKWLSMMKRRLLLAKRLLNQDDSVLIVTIDEKEYLRLGLLLEQTFPDARIQMVSSIINPKGSSRRQEFSRSDEYLFFVSIGAAQIVPTGNDMTLRDPTRVNGSVRWAGLMRAGANGRRRARPNLFYPIFVDNVTKRVHSVGEPLPIDAARSSICPEGTTAVWPISSNGSEATWGRDAAGLRWALSKGYVKIGRFTPGSERCGFTHLQAGQIKELASGGLKVVDRDSDGSLKVEYSGAVRKTMPTTAWHQVSHSSSEYGSTLLRSFLPDRAFPFPKSLYAVEDALRFFVATKPGALILDFFAGSGTTAHAVMRLNNQDGGHRQCISVTNNEVAAEEQNALLKRGLHPGDAAWEMWGICNYITMPRLTAAITGKTAAGEPINGNYKFTDEFPIEEGFAANLDYFRLDFLDPQEIQMGRQFTAILPILWMMAGSRGPRPDAPDAHAPWLLPDGCPFVVLMQETRFKEFVRHVESRAGLTHVFIVTNSQDTVYKLRHEWPELRVVQLYKDYLENFRINLSEKPLQ
jgi:adenine-specific DNA-methyltransferase